MSLSSTIDKLVDKYGVDVVLRNYTTTVNDYGEVVDDSYTEVTTKVVLYNNLSNKYLRELFGIVNTDVQTFLFKASEIIDNNTKLLIDGKEYVVNEVSTIQYQGDVIAKIVTCS